MKPISPHDPLDDLIAAALHGDLTPEERTQFESRLQTDAAARAAYQKALLMHDLLEKTHQSAQPDPAFEQRMVSGVRRKIEHEQRPRETAWESVVALWSGLKGFFTRKRKPIHFLGSAITILVIGLLLAGVALGPITSGIKQSPQNAALQRAHAAALADYQAQVDAGVPNPVMKSVKALPDGSIVTYSDTNANKTSTAAAPVEFAKSDELSSSLAGQGIAEQAPAQTAQPALAMTDEDKSLDFKKAQQDEAALQNNLRLKDRNMAMDAQAANERSATFAVPPPGSADGNAVMPQTMPSVVTKSGEQSTVEAVRVFPYPINAPTATTPSAPGNSAITATAPAAPAIDTRKLIRNAQLDLEVKSYQAAMDQITALTKAAGGYVDTSNSQKGGNGKLQGTVVVKVLPQNLDDFLFKLRNLGELANQSVSTDDVTKDYYDTQARLDNSRRMEEQLQDLLKHANSKVSDLLQVERELGRVRGDIEQMQGQLKLYDFQVQYATITIQMREKDLNQTAAYLLKEQDDFSLFATDVEGTFQKARQAADDFKAQILTANLNHNSGSDVSAELEVMVAPDKIEPFLAQIRSLGRVANFTRQTQRVAKDGGDSDQPADETLTEKDMVQVQLSIRSDDETRKQVALTVVTSAVDDALDQAKTAALANAGAEILSSSLNKNPDGQSTAQLSVRVPGKSYRTLLDAFKALGRTASFSLQRDDNSGPGASGDDAPVIVALSLTDDETPLQQTDLAVLATNVDDQAQQLKKDAAAAGVEIKASSFQRQPDGTEQAQLTFRLPMSKYPGFIASLQKLGKVESLTVQRNDRPDQTRTDDSAPAEINLQLHNQRDIVPDDTGLWATLRQTFGEGAGALFSSVRVIGVIIAFLIPWVFALGLIAWIARRIYISRKK